MLFSFLSGNEADIKEKFQNKHTASLLARASYTADHGESWASLGEFGRVHGGPRRVLRRVFHTGRHFRSIWANFAEKGRVPRKTRPVRLDKIAVLPGKQLLSRVMNKYAIAS